MATSSFFYGGSTAPEQNTVDQLIDSLNEKVAAADQDRVAAEQAATRAEAAATSADASEAVVTALSSQVDDTLTQANEALDTVTALSASVETSVATATTKASEAAASATNAASSQAAAAASQAAAATSASQAATSATSSATSATASQTARTESETARDGSVAARVASETARDAALASQTAAAASATSASTSATTATTQATASANSATSSASSATAAATSATNAASSATAAATSATNAASSAAAAASSATTVANSLTNYYDKTASDGRFAPISHAHTIANVTDLQTTLDSKAADSTVVKLTGDQTIAGVKTLSSNPVLSAGTANGVPYLNGSKVLTSGSALTYNGTNFGLNNDGNLVFASPDGNVEEKSRIQWLIEDGSEMSSIRVNRVNAFGESSMGFYTRGGGPSALRYSIGQDGTSYWSVGGSEQMRLTSTGLCIGTSSPTQVLTIAKSDNFPFIHWNNSSNTNIAFAGWHGGTGGSDDFRIGTTGAKPLTLQTNNTERARITSGGDFLVGTSSVGNTSLVSLSPGASRNGIDLPVSSGTTGIIFSGSAAYNYNAAVFNYNGATQVGYIQVQATATVYSTSSDYRLKEDIAPMTGALAKVAALKPVTYKWKADGSDGEGFIAHELQEVVPQCVTGEKDAVDEEGKPVYQGIDASFLVATLTAAIQEQQALIQNLTQRISQLEGASDSSKI